MDRAFFEPLGQPVKLATSLVMPSTVGYCEEVLVAAIGVLVKLMGASMMSDVMWASTTRMVMGVSTIMMGVFGE